MQTDFIRGDEPESPVKGGVAEEHDAVDPDPREGLEAGAEEGCPMTLPLGLRVNGEGGQGEESGRGARPGLVDHAREQGMGHDFTVDAPHAGQCDGTLVAKSGDE